MRYYSEDTVKQILADYDERIDGVFGELEDYPHIDLDYSSEQTEIRRGSVLQYNGIKLVAAGGIACEGCFFEDKNECPVCGALQIWVEENKAKKCDIISQSGKQEGDNGR